MTYYCSLCHGLQGEGYLTLKQMLETPDLLAATDDFIEYATIYARPGTKMSAWGTQAGGPVDERDIIDVIAHIRSWETLPPADIHDDTISGNADNGSGLYLEHCQSHYGSQGEGASALSLQQSEVGTASDGSFYTQ